MRTRHLLVPAAVVAALTIGSLAGCSSNGNSNYVTPQTPSASQSAGGSSDQSASGSSSSETLPSDFPKSDVPIVDGKILVARGDKDNGWSVTVQPTGKTGFADAKSKLEAAGYTQQPGATDSKATYTNGKYTVSVGTPGVAVTYNVTAL
ncbi:hypothetical protein [Leifsonia sp. AG29]|uniref:hypothetical protein n=1 Tax=Leifsonia sp. AG29 TaxID=2598860 RepID=UPI00131C6ED0|nr:hypothetical protein [Leifsonia sp. AG29]